MGTLVSSTVKTYRHDIAEIFLKVALNTINLNLKEFFSFTVFEFRKRNDYQDLEETLPIKITLLQVLLNRLFSLFFPVSSILASTIW